MFAFRFYNSSFLLYSLTCATRSVRRQFKNGKERTVLTPHKLGEVREKIVTKHNSQDYTLSNSALAEHEKHKPAVSRLHNRRLRTPPWLTRRLFTCVFAVHKSAVAPSARRIRKQHSLHRRGKHLQTIPNNTLSPTSSTRP